MCVCVYIYIYIYIHITTCREEAEASSPLAAHRPLPLSEGANSYPSALPQAVNSNSNNSTNGIIIIAIIIIIIIIISSSSIISITIVSINRLPLPRSGFEIGEIRRSPG